MQIIDIIDIYINELVFFDIIYLTTKYKYFISKIVQIF